MPAAASAALTSPIETSRRWKMDGGEHGVGAAVDDRRDHVAPGPEAPPEAMTGTRTRDVIARSSCGVVAGLRAVAVDRGHEQLARPELDRPLRPGDRRRARPARDRP